MLKVQKCPKCNAKIRPNRLTWQSGLSIKRTFRCPRCGAEIMLQSNPSKVLLPPLEKHKLVKKRKKRLWFNPKPKSFKEAERLDFAQQKKSKSVRAVSGGAIESNRRRH